MRGELLGMVMASVNQVRASPEAEGANNFDMTVISRTTAMDAFKKFGAALLHEARLD